MCYLNGLKTKKNHKYFDDEGIGDCFLIKYTSNEVALINTPLDMISNGIIK